MGNLGVHVSVRSFVGLFVGSLFQVLSFKLEFILYSTNVKTLQLVSFL